MVADPGCQERHHSSNESREHGVHTHIQHLFVAYALNQSEEQKFVRITGVLLVQSSDEGIYTLIDARSGYAMRS